MLDASTLCNKSLTTIDCGTHDTVLDGPVLGGCGRGECGDPGTFVPDLWRDIIDRYEIKSVLDVGCGFGYSTRWFDEAGMEVRGLEGSQEIASGGVSNGCVQRHDFREGKPSIPPDFDLGWCSEFLEHIHAEYEPCYMAALVRCKYLAVSAALPGFGGHHHVNEQPSEYWIGRFERYGFEFLQDETNRMRRLVHERHPRAYFQANGLFFRRVKDVPIPRHWTDVEGDLTPDEAETLQRLARGRRVLLAGGEGRLALAIGQTAKQVTCVETYGDGLGHLLASVKLAGMDSKVEVCTDPIEEVQARRFEMIVFHGTDPDDYLETLLPGGVLAWACWTNEHNREMAADCGLEPKHIARAGTLGVLETAKWQVAVTLPHSRGVDLNAYKSLRTASIGRFTSVVAEMDMDCGCLVQNFNTLLAQSLHWKDDGKATHMAMIHSDISAEKGWLDLLAEEMATCGAIAISAVVAIKDPADDRTSTAIGSKSDPWEARRYVRLRDRGRMPVTFTGRDVCEGDDEVMLINTGLLLLDLRHDFWETFCFQVHAAIFRREGKRYPIFRPEDWEMSRALDEARLPYAATWRPYTEHLGGKSWPNRQPVTQVIHNA